MCAVWPTAAACSPDPCRAWRAQSLSPGSSRSAARRSTRRGKRRKSSRAGATATRWRSARLLPCAYDASVKKLISAIETLRPDALLMTGQAARRGVVCVERFAHNLDDAKAPDNDGALRRGLRISRAAPEWLETAASVRTIASAINEAGIPARMSRNAGGFVCNHLYFGALQYLSEKRSAIPAVFVHLPVTPEQSRKGRAKGGSRRPKPRTRFGRPRRRSSTN